MTVLRLQRVSSKIFVVLAILLGAAAAIAAPPRGYKCGDGKKLAGKGCECPAGKVDARDKANFAICITEPAPTACLADRKGEEVLKIDSSPDGAAIYIGDKSCGVVAYTPWTGRLAAGPVNVILERTSFDAAARTVTVSPRATQELYIPLVRTNVGSLDVRGDGDKNVVGATILVDNQQQGVVPTVVKLPAGRHKLEIVKPGFDSYAQWVDIQDSQIVTVFPALRATASRMGKLIIDADVAGVEVYIDEVKQVAAIPFVTSVTEGAHTVEVRKAGATTWKQLVTVRANDQTLVRAELAKSMKQAPQLATIKVTSAVAGGEVFVDGTTIGKAPLQVELAPGEHWLVVRLAGHKPFEQKLRLDAGQRIEIAADLPATASVTITSTPAGSTVFVDGTRIGTTPITTELVLGDHVIWVDRSGYQRFEERVTLKGPAKTVSAQLKP